ncbi:MAG: YkgJ family cysteine cluster protein [Treponema sp.]|nr:YkgJ family cysteine cluster protein [Treponema sp.]
MTEIDSNIKNVLSKIKGTNEYDILVKTEKMYDRISKEQSKWYEISKFSCPSGCGNCCRHFEPDLLECEALYMAAWLIENQNDVAMQIKDGSFPFDNGSACLLFNPNSDYHCSIYNGRAVICRLFGASGFKDKKGCLVWKPCKFYPVEKLSEHNPPISHKQYSKDEVIDLFGTTPPLMSDLMEESFSFTSTKTFLIRDILPKTIAKLMWIMTLADSN